MFQHVSANTAALSICQYHLLSFTANPVLCTSDPTQTQIVAVASDNQTTEAGKHSDGPALKKPWSCLMIGSWVIQLYTVVLPNTYILYVYIYMYIYICVYIYIWRFPKMRVPPNHPF